ncbi:hypothetical protein [Modestobacter sp. DSM 44400]|uniref:hypothetical protein n=1 Tax=Modestobacter sp. DSM 44400 TaxID=1550230 RepID=UPI001115439F|nr:hypothetical protein [Modestobacter sp. DSM 44400]
MDPAVRRAIAAIGEDAWTPIRYPGEIWKEAEQRWISDAEVAETEFTAFTFRRRAEHVTARLIVRRVKRLNPASVPPGQTALFGEYRHHAVFTDSPLSMPAAAAAHRDHAIVEQVIAELRAGPLAHLPSGKFTANAAWLVCAAIAFQPHPRRRCPGRGVPRQGPNGDDPRAAHRRPGLDRLLRPTTTPVPAAELALADRRRAAVHRRPRPTGRGRGLTTQPSTERKERPTWRSRTDRRLPHAHRREPFHRSGSRH